MFTNNQISWRFTAATLVLAVGGSPTAAQDNEPTHIHLEELVVTGQHQHMHTGTGDASQHLVSQGVNFSSAGGISSLPILRGMNDDRIKLLIDGAAITAACANHMNPALSYMDASRVSLAQVIAGTTPVSMGGDSIAGTIVIESEQPVYADNSGGLMTSGSAAAFGRSANNNRGVAVTYSVANENANLTYSGTYDDAESYRDGNGDKVLDTLYQSESHTLTLGLKDDLQSVLVKLTYQNVPHQGFPNQYMDMVDNQSTGLNTRYLRDFAWGQLETVVSVQEVKHEMGFFTDEKPGTMPMNTEGLDIGYKIAGELPTASGTLRLGHEYQRFETEDWWPAVAGSMMMGPNDYININDGERTRYALYIESENPLTPKWHTELGLRYEHVVSDAGDVQPYNTMPGMMGMNLDAMAAADFNARDRHQSDDNFDLTATAHYSFNADSVLELGYARKTRSPNLYERYSWGRGTMAMTMIGWFGDANGYVGDIDLDPEVAHTLNAALTWSNVQTGRELTASTYYTHVDGYIDAAQIGTFNPRMAMHVTKPLLQFTNIDARFYGLEIQGRTPLLNTARHELQLSSRMAYTRGERADNGGDLYHIMPLNLSLALEHRYANWTSSLQVSWVDRKDRVDSLRMEAETAAYTLVDLDTSYTWQQLTLSLGVSNLFDRQYDLPLGGANYAGWLAGGMTGQIGSLAGEGRSVDIGIKYAF